MRKVYIILFIAYLGLDVYLLFSKGDSLPVIQKQDLFLLLANWLNVQPDKVLHAVIFFPMIPLAWLAIQPKTMGAKILILYFGLFFGLLTEGIQYFIPGRMADIADIWADIIGSALGTPFISFARHDK